MSVRIAIVSTRALVRALLAAWIGSQADMTCVAQVAHHGEADLGDPTIVIWDARDCSAFRDIESLRRSLPEVRVLVVTACKGDYVLHRGANLATGFVHETDRAEILSAAILAVASGGVYHSATVVQRQGAMALRMLTSRELEVLELAASGVPDDETARLVGITSATAETHRRNAMRKLGAADWIELVILGIRLGIVAPERVTLGERRRRSSSRRKT